jgi:phosphatidate cytidylyltransferase
MIRILVNMPHGQKGKLKMINNLEILKTTCIVYAFIFGGASLLTFAFRKTNWGRNIIAAISMWFVIFCLFIFGAYAGWLPFAGVIIFISILSIREFYKINNVCGSPQLMISFIALLLMALAIKYKQYDIFHAVPLLAVFLFFAVQLFRKSCTDITRTVGTQVLGLIYWGWLPMHFLRLQGMPGGFGAIVMLCTMIALNDNSAYYTGKLLGKNSPKFAPLISPNKTWAGFAGGAAATLLAAALFGYTLPHISLWQRLLLGVAVIVLIPAGDLMESAMKRDAGVKDSSNLIPGHGGMMDRFDSWIFTAPMYCYLLTTYSML